MHCGSYPPDRILNDCALCVYAIGEHPRGATVPYTLWLYRHVVYMGVPLLP